MALLEPGCYWGHEDCPGHYIRPDLTGLPIGDSPKVGRCWCGQVGALWEVPLDRRFYCKACLRMALRIATFPNALRFPRDD